MSLDECLERFTWASKYVDHLDAEFAQLRRAYRHPALTVELQKAGRIRDYRVEGAMPTFPSDIGLRISDCAHHFRATLDNLVYTAALDTGTTLNSEQRRSLNFPIATQRSNFKEARVRGAIAPLPIRAQAIIQGAQPYKRGKDADRHPLAVLRVLSDMDKHRALPAVILHAQGVGPYETPLSDEVPSRIEGATWSKLTDKVVPGTNFVRLELPKRYANMDVQIGFMFSFVVEPLEDMWQSYPDGIDFGIGFNRIRDYIGNRVVPKLARFCNAPAPVQARAVSRVEYDGAFLWGGWRDPERRLDLSVRTASERRSLS